LEQLSQQKRDFERDLRAALMGNKLTLHYQPVVDLEKCVITSFEALLRWNCPLRGKVTPAVFIPFAEEVGLMPEIGDWVLQSACREAATWPDELKVSINLSPAQFHLPDLVHRVAAALGEAGLPPHRLELEVTETAMIDDIAAARAVLEDLRALGVTIALDDFGTGYSSLSFLRTLPFNRIKIDRSFVQDLGLKPEALAIVRAVAGLCSSLGVAATAEGAESDGQIALLRAEGCSEIQGFRIARPIPASKVQSWVAAFAANRDEGYAEV
jgi:EAL domain-containing protein (putative c-di-GMP-specific phosphodiesterase class I)